MEAGFYWLHLWSAPVGTSHPRVCTNLGYDVAKRHNIAPVTRGNKKTPAAEGRELLFFGLSVWDWFCSFLQDGTALARVTTIHNNIAKMLSEQGFVRTPRQVINKLKALKKKYLAITDHMNWSRMGWVDCPFYKLCQSIYCKLALANLLRLYSFLWMYGVVWPYLKTYR